MRRKYDYNYCYFALIHRISHKKKLVLTHFAKALCMIIGKLLHISYFNFSFQVTTLQ
jgi:hypothetical protein